MFQSLSMNLASVDTKQEILSHHSAKVTQKMNYDYTIQKLQFKVRFCRLAGLKLKHKFKIIWHTENKHHEKERYGYFECKEHMTKFIINLHIAKHGQRGTIMEKIMI
jgi:hypothetical protein